MKNSMMPIKENDRIVSLDILRGMAILGIFLVNMPSFFSPILYLNPKTYWTNTSDTVLYAIVDIFAQASFYPLFAFLFGYGAMMMAERAALKNRSFPLNFTRRLWFLLLFGLIHAFFVWHGDILITYAITGLGLLLFYKRKGKTLIITGLLLYVIPFTLLVLSSLLLDQEELMSILYNPEAVIQSVLVYSEGCFMEVMKQRSTDWLFANDPTAIWLLLINILPLMLIGAGFAKLKWLTNIKQYKKLLMWLMVISFVGGMLLKIQPYINGFSYTNMLSQDQFGGPLLALFYITSVALLLERKRVSRFMKPLANVGRMSISNYLFQSLLCTTLFYSYGFGLYGKISYTLGFCLVIVIYAMQILISKWWMKRFNYGPIEYLWRFGTYGQKPVFKRVRSR